ncbi:hypothetical protein HU200_062773 [Digitaria exilis]|uniref:Uncharacterized protein n=1 Tax=Digitaria exilis TaxID=1010633 RepID=A0A835E085_9POAL|nr:hypothetical protein HU200_062773 [Digitaria exilis]
MAPVSRSRSDRWTRLGRRCWPRARTRRGRYTGCTRGPWAPQSAMQAHRATAKLPLPCRTPYRSTAAAPHTPVDARLSVVSPPMVKGTTEAQSHSGNLLIALSLPESQLHHMSGDKAIINIAPHLDVLQSMSDWDIDPGALL